LKRLTGKHITKQRVFCNKQQRISEHPWSPHQRLDKHSVVTKNRRKKDNT